MRFLDMIHPTEILRAMRHLGDATWSGHALLREIPPTITCVELRYYYVCRKDFISMS